MIGLSIVQFEAGVRQYGSMLSTKVICKPAGVPPSNGVGHRTPVMLDEWYNSNNVLLGYLLPKKSSRFMFLVIFDPVRT